MSRTIHLLKKSALPGEIEIHEDLLSVGPSALSRRRALKVGRLQQLEMEDPEGANKCRICDPNQKEPGLNNTETVIQDRVSAFLNDFPYLPHDQRVVFLWTDDLDTRKILLHRFRLRELKARELYWLLKGCWELGKKYEQPTHALDLMSMVVGFNFGKLAGQSLPHFHAQYGWEVVLAGKVISRNELNLYFEELAIFELIIHDDATARVVAPWTPKGQFVIDLYFKDKYEITDLEEDDIKTFAVVGERLVKKYLALGIQNLNIVFTNSPYQREAAPLVAHFVPRVNMPALYEIKGVTVVDTPPQKIAEEFRGATGSGDHWIDWPKVFDDAVSFDPDHAFRPVESQPTGPQQP